ncbi:MAG: GlsB/YeaQ/YmgE family stress response membrane protein [Solirubrobacteraceae bacterium]|nr:GlsB/YeaQ/YmgE family stress response membrane protein [Solirubrobacteraceae bacterium]
MIGAIILGLVAGAIGKLLVPGKQGGGIILTTVLGLVGALVGYFVFSRVLGIGDDDAFDLGGLLSAIIGVVIVLVAYGAITKNSSRV